MKLNYESKELIKGYTKLAAVFVIFYLYFRYPFYNYLNFKWSIYLWVVGFPVLGAIVSHVTREINNRQRGRGAEVDVEEKLEELPIAFKILSNLVIGKNKGNVDEVVVGPTGIWVIEVKSQSGTITFNGSQFVRDGKLLEGDFLKQVWAEHYAVSGVVEESLKRKFKLQPVIVFSDSNATVKFGFKKINGVYVIGRRWLNSLVQNNVIEHLDDKTIDMVKRSLDKYRENSDGVEIIN